MNETECANLIESVKWTEPGSLISLAILEFINILVIVGNCLVIAAVFCSTKLRSVTNFFIVNLAVADLLVGLAVLPFSATWEVFKVWIFGDVWCRIWLAVDVWMCTASILNLCAISLDRYVAVTRPVTYPSIMSTRKAKSLIAGIWVLSFVICFPPLVKWKDQESEDVETATQTTTYIRGNNTLYYATQIISSSSSSPSSLSSLSSSAITSDILTTTPITNDLLDSSTILTTTATIATSAVSQSCPWICELTNDRGYVLYSALGSFYIPMFVMLFFYWRIYRAAVRTTRAINQGFKTTKGGSKNGSGYDESRLTLRIHRGRGTPSQRAPLTGNQTIGGGSMISVNSNNFDDNNLQKRATSMSSARNPMKRNGRQLQQQPSQQHDKIAIKVSFPSSENITNNDNESTSLLTYSSSKNPVILPGSKTGSSAVVAQASGSNVQTKLCGNETTFNLDDNKKPSDTVVISTSSSCNQSSNNNSNNKIITTTAPSTALNNNLGSSNNNNNNRCNNITLSTASNRKSFDAINIGSPPPSATTPKSKANKFFGGGSGGNANTGGSGKHNKKFQIKRFRMETKAAKTLGIVVGGFIVCWLPFFTMYLIRAFCETCIEPLVFSILFWLGYCNSAINPLLYALFSNEFRLAFKRILFRCLWTRSAFRASENFHANVQKLCQAPVTFHRTISGCNNHDDHEFEHDYEFS